jgi:hypothetical protein
MEDMTAMNYEYLIRRAYQKGRFGAKGADADIFRSLLEAFWDYQNAKGSDKSGLEVEYQQKAAQVKKFIGDAINHSLKTYTFNQEQKAKLTQCISDLDTYDLKTIQQVIDRADKTILELGIYPG